MELLYDHIKYYFFDHEILSEICKIHKDTKHKKSFDYIVSVRQKIVDLEQCNVYAEEFTRLYELNNFADSEKSELLEHNLMRRSAKTYKYLFDKNCKLTDECENLEQRSEQTGDLLIKNLTCNIPNLIGQNIEIIKKKIILNHYIQLV